MKRILSLLLCVSLSLFLVACGGNNYGNGMKRSPAVKERQNAPLNALADGEDPKSIPQQVEELFDSYIVDGKYTKLTTLRYDSTSGNYHAGVNARQRRTYYDETTDALLMGDYDGGFDDINSGYAKSGTNDMDHYTNNAETITLENLFSARDVNYKVSETTPNNYFDVLSELADEVGKSTVSRWTYANNVYTYTSDQVATINGNSYTNGLLKMFQYFAAPMLLLNNNIGLLKVTVEEKDAYIGATLGKALIIKLYDNLDNEVSHAFIVKGLTMENVVVCDDNLLYLQVGVWNANNAWFAAYFFIDGDNTWVKMDVVGNGIYSVEIPAGYKVNNANVIFVRMDPANTALSWAAKWNQTNDLLLNGNFGRSYSITGWGEVEGANSTGVWY